MKVFNSFAEKTHRASSDAGWWPQQDRENPFVVPLKLVLIHSEVSEAMEGFRKNLMDDKLTHRSMIEVELADALIRIGDLAGFLGLDLDGAIEEKMNFNKTRLDHQSGSREQEDGKKF